MCDSHIYMQTVPENQPQHREIDLAIGAEFIKSHVQRLIWMRFDGINERERANVQMIEETSEKYE